MRNELINIGQKLKNIRFNLKLSQKELALELTSYSKNNNARYFAKSKRKEESLTFTQVDISNVENDGSIIKDKMYLILSYYCIKHNVNLNYLFNESPVNSMFNYEVLLN